MRKQGCTTADSYQNCSCSTLKIYVTSLWLGNTAMDDHQQFHHNATYQTRIDDRYVCIVKGKGHPITGHESPEAEQMYSCTLRSTWALEEGWVVNATHPRPLYPPGKTRYALYKRLGGPQGWSGRVRKISPLQRFDPRNVQPVASRYTERAIAAHPLYYILEFRSF
jgi:hypothetical protein